MPNFIEFQSLLRAPLSSLETHDAIERIEEARRREEERARDELNDHNDTEPSPPPDGAS